MSLNGWNAEFVDDLYRRWKTDPESVDADWKRFFEGFDLGLVRSPGHGDVAHSLQGKVDSLIYHYRDIGHFAADLDQECHFEIM